MNEVPDLWLFLGVSVFLSVFTARLSFDLAIATIEMLPAASSSKSFGGDSRALGTRPKRDRAVRSFARLSGPLPGSRPASERSLDHPDQAALHVHYRLPHESRCPAFASRRIQTSQTCHPVAPATDISTRTLDARVLDPSSTVFDHSPDPAPSTSHNAHRASQAPTVFFATRFRDIGHELRQSSAWAHYERARTDQTEHLENSSRHR